MGGGCCIGDCCVANCCIGKVIKDFVNALFGKSEGSSSGGRTESYTPDTSSIEATIRVQQALTQFKDDTQKRSTLVENDIIKSSRQYLDDFLDELKKYNNISYGNARLNINLQDLQKKNRATEDKIHGYITSRVIKRISLDDEECLEILKMESGKAKEDAFDRFYTKVLKEALSELSKELKDRMKVQTDSVCDTIKTRLDDILTTWNTKNEEFRRIKKVKDTDEAKMEQEQMRLSYYVALCDNGLALLQ